MHHRSKLTAALAALTLVGAGLGAAATATTAGPSSAPTKQTLASGLVSPLSLAVTKGGTRYFTQNFIGVLNRQEPGQKKPSVVYANEERFEVGAVSARGRDLRFALSKNNRRGVIMASRNGGKPFLLANLGAYEKKNNPDGVKAYGFRGLTAECRSQLSPEGPPGAYKGIVETHPYATTMARGWTYVADAAANAVIIIAPNRQISAAVVPPTPVRIDAATAQKFGFPPCVAGKRYWFESVPTDVEMGRDGNLYVTSLPGGPEDPSLGANGRVYRVNPLTGRVTKVAGGLVSATGLAVAGNGDIFVAELFAGRISKVKAGRSTPRTFIKVPLPADVEMANGDVYATIKTLPGEDQPPAGKVVRIRR